jgi:hypothetical protein
MTGTKANSTRRRFLLQGGTVVSAGVATAYAASSPTSDEATSVQEQLAILEDREAIRQLHLTFTTLMEQRRYEAAAELFDEQARLHLSGVGAAGKPAILELLADRYRHQNVPVIHNSYRHNTVPRGDTVTLSEDRREAAATFHVEVELCRPLQADCTAAQMARLQGNVADRRWETGRFEAKYVKIHGQWKIASLSYPTLGG